MPESLASSIENFIENDLPSCDSPSPRLINAVVRNPRVLYGKFRYIFIFSHTRGYTSLLSHILGSHPEISGYFELHRNYIHPRDFLRMRLLVAEGLDYQLRGRYILDKILTEYQTSPTILQRNDVFCIFMLRKPEEALRSMIARQIPDVSNALSYYVNRLKFLQKLSLDSPNYIYLDGESLIENTDFTLNFISTFLELRTKLLPSFTTFKYTGLRGYGDSSKYISQGVIFKDRFAYDDFVIPDHILNVGMNAYLEARQFLKSQSSYSSHTE